MAWDATQYERFLAERTRPAKDLAHRVAETGARPRTILDLGCGPGNSTEVVGATFPDATVLGVDVSSEMVEAARRERPGHAYRVFDASNDLAVLGTFDLVFSNACLQWVPDHPRLLRNIAAVLDPGGALAVQVPLTRDMPIQRVLAGLANSPQWADRLPQEHRYHTLEPLEYHDVLDEVFVDYSIWTTTYFHRLGSVDDVVEWYRGSALHPYLAVLDPGERRAFLADVRRGLEEHYRPRSNGEVVLGFPRLFFLAKK